MIRADLRRARARWIRATGNPAERRERRQSDFLSTDRPDGQTVDFHSLRVSYVTLLVQSCVSAKVAQELARHSDPRLTMNIYAKVGIHDLDGALARLPDLERDSADHEDQALAATGTYDAAPANGKTDPHLKPRQSVRETLRSGATRFERRSAQPESSSAKKTLKIGGQCEGLRSDAEQFGKGGGGIRTHESRICNPLP